MWFRWKLDMGIALGCTQTFHRVGTRMEQGGCAVSCHQLWWRWNGIFCANLFTLLTEGNVLFFVKVLLHWTCTFAANGMVQPDVHTAWEVDACLSPNQCGICCIGFVLTIYQVLRPWAKRSSCHWLGSIYIAQICP